MELPGRLQIGVEFVKKLTPAELRKLADRKVTDIVQREIPRARARIAELEKKYPSAKTKELAQHLIEQKKSVAGMVGGISGVFGIFSVPADLLVMLWLELVLHVDIATLYKANLKADHARAELLDLFGDTHGVGPLARSTPRALGSVAAILLSRGGLSTLGRAVPLVAAPVSAYLNNKHIQAVGEAAVTHYEGFGKARRKAKGGGEADAPSTPEGGGGRG